MHALRGEHVHHYMIVSLLAGGGGFFESVLRVLFKIPGYPGTPGVPSLLEGFYDSATRTRYPLRATSTRGYRVGIPTYR
eukprot:1404810-Rhodomonas_salina.1